MLVDLNLLPMNVDSERFSEDLDDGPGGLLVCGRLVDEPASQVRPYFVPTAMYFLRNHVFRHDRQRYCADRYSVTHRLM
jgi:hypothetical protein